MSTWASVLAEGGWWGPVAAGACMAALPWLKRDSVAARSFVIAVAAALMWRYLFWRWTQSLPPIELSVDTFASLIFIGVESLALIGSTISLFFLTRVRNRTREVEAIWAG